MVLAPLWVVPVPPGVGPRSPAGGPRCPGDVVLGPLEVVPILLGSFPACIPRHWSEEWSRPAGVPAPPTLSLEDRGLLPPATLSLCPLPPWDGGGGVKLNQGSDSQAILELGWTACPAVGAGWGRAQPSPADSVCLSSIPAQSEDWPECGLLAGAVSVLGPQREVRPSGPCPTV